MYDVIPDSPHPGTPRGLVLEKIVAQTGSEEKSSFVKRIALHWITRCLPHLFSPDNLSKDFRDVSKGTFRIEPTPQHEIASRMASVPLIPPEFVAELKRELLEEINNRASEKLVGLKRTSTEPEVRLLPPPKKQRGGLDRSATQPPSSPALSNDVVQQPPPSPPSSPSKDKAPQMSKDKRKSTTPQRSTLPKERTKKEGEKGPPAQSLRSSGIYEISSPTFKVPRSSTISEGETHQSDGDLRAEVKRLGDVVSSMSTLLSASQKKERFLQHEMANIRAEMNILKLQLLSGRLLFHFHSPLTPTSHPLQCTIKRTL